MKYSIKRMGTSLCECCRYFVELDGIKQNNSAYWQQGVTDRDQRDQDGWRVLIVILMSILTRLYMFMF